MLTFYPIWTAFGKLPWTGAHKKTNNQEILKKKQTQSYTTVNQQKVEMLKGRVKLH